MALKVDVEPPGLDHLHEQVNAQGNACRNEQITQGRALAFIAQRGRHQHEQGVQQRNAQQPERKKLKVISDHPAGHIPRYQHPELFREVPEQRHIRCEHQDPIHEMDVPLALPQGHAVQQAHQNHTSEEDAATLPLRNALRWQ
jgi:hypothetical protein